MSTTTSYFDLITPQNCINAKVRKLHRLLDGIYQTNLKPFGLKGSMLSILFIIGKSKGINQKNIAEKLVLDQSTVSRDIKKLGQKGWITIYRGEDSRITELEISERGYELLEKVSPVWEETHRKVEKLLGSFNIQQLDNIIYAVRSSQSELE